MNFFMKPYSTLFSLTLIMGTFITLTSNNWLSMWMGLELNLYSFIPLTLMNKKNQEKEAMIKYFLIQSLASMILLLGVLLTKTGAMIIVSALTMKLGIAPSHFWIPPIMNSISWTMCWILSTVQKLAPITILSSTLISINPLLTVILASLSSLVGGIGGLAQTQLRAILAYSSIGHMGWILASSLTSQTIMFLYFLSYIFIISSVMKPFSILSIMFMNNKHSPYTSPNLMKLSIIPSLLSLAGLPPTFGFFPKLMVIYSLSSMNLTALQLILILSSTMNLFYYLKIITLMFFSSPSQNNMFYHQKPLLFISSTLISSSLAILTLPLFI